MENFAAPAHTSRGHVEARLFYGRPPGHAARRRSTKAARCGTCVFAANPIRLPHSESSVRHRLLCAQSKNGPVADSDHGAVRVVLSPAIVEDAEALGSRRARAMRGKAHRYGRGDERANVVGALAEKAVHQWSDDQGWRVTPLYLSTSPEACDLRINGYAVEVKSGRRWIDRAINPFAGDGLALKLSQWAHLANDDAIVWCRVPDPPYDRNVTVELLGWAPPAQIAAVSRFLVLAGEHDFSFAFQAFDDRPPPFTKPDADWRPTSLGALRPIGALAEMLAVPSPPAPADPGRQTEKYACGHAAVGPACLTCWLSEMGLPETCLYDGRATFHMTDDCSYLTGGETRVSVADIAVRASSCVSCFRMAYHVRRSPSAVPDCRGQP